jgi:hypothetical protein
MNNNADVLYDWAPENMLEVTFENPDDFLKIKESLTRIGIASKKQQKLTQTAHILHKRERYYIVHFLELFKLDGKTSALNHGDVMRRDAIATLLEQWNLLTIVDPRRRLSPDQLKEVMGNIAVIPYAAKPDWELISKYTIGNSRQRVVQQ